MQGVEQNERKGVEQCGEADGYCARSVTTQEEERCVVGVA